MKYIDAEKLIAEIESIRLIPQTSADYNDGRDDMKMMVLDLIDSLQQEQPEHGHFVSDYISGKKPIFNVGDILAYYVCTSNEEGERNMGKIEKVVFDEEDGWLYIFENGVVYSEEDLVSDDFYKKN